MPTSLSKEVDATGKAGYLLHMALSAFCATCGRTVYLEEGDTPICPVCSSPLVQTIDEDEREAMRATDDTSTSEHPDQPGGAK